MKNDRHQKVIELINNYDIETQEELVDKLREAGYDVTQATVSRDIRFLKLSKVPLEDGRQKYKVMVNKEAPSEKYVRILKDGLLTMTNAQNLVIIRTVPGMAMAVAAALDSLAIPEVLGCIAGDDTIMCATQSIEDTGNVVKTLQKLIG